MVSTGPTLFDASVRQTLIAQPANLASLLTYLAHHLFSLLHSELFPSTGRAPAQDTTREALNCLRVLGRIVVIVYEAEGVAREGGVSGGEAFAREHLWARQTVRKEGKPEEQFTITDSDDEGEGSDPLSKLDDTEVLPSLADRLFQCTIDLLFCAGFTLPSSVQGGSDEKVHVSSRLNDANVVCDLGKGSWKYSQSGVHCGSR